jgi:hypothetical protein
MANFGGFTALCLLPSPPSVFVGVHWTPTWLHQGHKLGVLVLICSLRKARAGTVALVLHYPSLSRALQRQYSTWITMLLFTHKEFLFTAQGSLQQLLLWKVMLTWPFSSRPSFLPVNTLPADKNFLLCMWRPVEPCYAPGCGLPLSGINVVTYSIHFLLF